MCCGFWSVTVLQGVLCGLFRSGHLGQAGAGFHKVCSEVSLGEIGTGSVRSDLELGKRGR